jgi:hypothetical protein
MWLSGYPSSPSFLYKIAHGITLEAGGILGNVACITLFPMCFFNWDTWKTWWIEVDVGNNSLDATRPTFFKIKYGP